MRKLNAVVAAFVLATALVWATMLTTAPTTQAALSDDPSRTACLKAGQSLAPWFTAEFNRRAYGGVSGRDDFNLMLAWFRAAQSQCASGLTDRSLANLKALELKLAGSMNRTPPEEPDPEDG